MRLYPVKYSMDHEMNSERYFTWYNLTLITVGKAILVMRVVFFRYGAHIHKSGDSTRFLYFLSWRRSTENNWVQK